jgi:hypothetical protein
MTDGPFPLGCRTNPGLSCQLLKLGIDCARLPREAIFVALPRKVDTMLPSTAEWTLPRGNLGRVEPNRSGSLPRGKGISVYCALSAKTVSWRRNSVDQQTHAAAALRCWTRTRLLTHKQMKEYCRTRTAARGSRALSIPGFTAAAHNNWAPAVIWLTHQPTNSSLHST